MDMIKDREQNKDYYVAGIETHIIRYVQCNSQYDTKIEQYLIT